MRSFIAVPLPEECREILEQIQRPLRSLGTDVGWTSVSSIHLTLKFLGEIDPNRVDEIASSLRPATVPAFKLRVRGLGAFPNLHSPRVIWCGVEGEIERLSSLQAGVETACEGLGFERETRPFHPHLTLGRVRDKLAPGSARAIAEAARGVHYRGRAVARSVELMASELTPQGSRYRVMASLPLKGGS